MSKELTEQWRNGKLPVGSYYINLVGDVERVDFFEGLKWERTEEFGIEEVLAPVPSYDYIKRLQEQLKEANEVIESLRTYDFTVDDENAEYYQVKWKVEAKRFYKNRKWGVMLTVETRLVSHN